MKKPILVTGGAGFIGSHLVDLFDKENVDYLVLDNLSAGSIKNIPIAVAQNRFVNGDVKNYQLVQELIISSSCVIHMACNVGVRNVIYNPIETIETNINSLKQIAYYCSLNKIPLVFFSTSLVYSPHKERKDLFSETDQTNTLGFHPVSMYVYSKKIGELLCDYYKQKMGLKYIIIRPFNMIGIRQQSHTGMVVPAFIKSAISSKTIDIYGNGKQTRTFSDVKTAVKLLWEIIRKDTSYGQIYNLATTEKSTPIIELAEMIKGILDEPIKIYFIPINRVYGDSYRDVKFRTPSLAKLKQHISAWDERDLKEILKEIIEDERQTNNLN
ncbi:MAG TPA: NAD-dependent epimerase/dehydratase family protein [Ignavibacteriaceae bacterium]|nr:NAD-dependent epimerase/dehydratase family protein [Ignavibacteriaceae bacterium]